METCVKDLCDLADFCNEGVKTLITQARSLEQQQSSRTLQGKVLVLLYLNPSLRNLTSLQATMIRLGGGTFVISPEMSWNPLRNCHGWDCCRTYQRGGTRYCVLCRRYRNRGDRAKKTAGNWFSRWLLSGTSIIVRCSGNQFGIVNSTSMQSLADWKTLKDFSVPRNGGKLVFSWVYHPEALPLAIPGDTIHMAVARGMDVTVLRPDEF